MFEWDEAKARSNALRHGVSFHRIIDFQFGSALIEPDTRLDYGELRMIALGMLRGRIHVVVYTVRNDRRRIISFRKANEREAQKYVEHLRQS